MNITIYQINTDRDKNKVKFRGPEQDRPIDSSIYDRVFTGDVDCKTLEDVFEQFNTKGHRLHRGHSLSVSDIVGYNGKYWFCDKIGFKEVDFQPSQADVSSNLIRVLVLEPKRPPYISEIENTLEGQQKAVDGYIEYLYDDDAIIVCNEEGKLRGMDGCRRINGDVIAGPFFVAGDDGEKLCSLTDDQINKYSKRFAAVEDISQDEVNRYIDGILIGM